MNEYGCASECVCVCMCVCVHVCVRACYYTTCVIVLASGQLIKYCTLDSYSRTVSKII